MQRARRTVLLPVLLPPILCSPLATRCGTVPLQSTAVVWELLWLQGMLQPVLGRAKTCKPSVAALLELL